MTLAASSGVGFLNLAATGVIEGEVNATNCDLSCASVTLTSSRFAASSLGREAGPPVVNFHLAAMNLHYLRYTPNRHQAGGVGLWVGDSM